MQFRQVRLQPHLREAGGDAGTKFDHWLVLVFHRTTQNLSDLLFHTMAMARGAPFQALLDLFFQFANGDLRQSSFLVDRNDIMISFSPGGRKIPVGRIPVGRLMRPQRVPLSPMLAVGAFKPGTYVGCGAIGRLSHLGD